MKQCLVHGVYTGYLTHGNRKGREWTRVRHRRMKKSYGKYRKNSSSNIKDISLWKYKIIIS